MIKIGITGGETKTAAELLRLAINHPDVDISTIHSPSNAGKGVATIHHGFIGEEKLLFSSNLDATGLDIVFLVSPIYSSTDWAKLMADHPGLRIVLFPQSAGLGDALSSAPVLGLSEMNRKPLVRGARVAVIPAPLLSPLIVVLYPLASHLMLPPSMSIRIEAPADLTNTSVPASLSEEIVRLMQGVQSSFHGKINTVIEPGSSERGMKCEIEMDAASDISEIMRLYDAIYDDHNFTFMTTREVGMEEAEGTHKIILSFSRPAPGRLRIEAVADARMRGGASEAIHVMNLFFNLHEKTGLTLKSTRW